MLLLECRKRGTENSHCFSKIEKHAAFSYLLIVFNLFFATQNLLTIAFL